MRLSASAQTLALLGVGPHVSDKLVAIVGLDVGRCGSHSVQRQLGVRPCFIPVSLKVVEAAAAVPTLPSPDTDGISYHCFQSVYIERKSSRMAPVVIPL